MSKESTKKHSSLGDNFLRELIGLLSALLIGLYATAIPFITNSRFFFHDDEQNQFFPYFIDIGEHLHHGQWLGMTLSTFYGGNLIDDWQYALYNPFSLLTYWIIAPMKNLLLIGLFLSGVYLTLISLGGYCLGRIFGLRRIFSLSIAAVLTMNNFLQYMYSDSWIPGLVSYTWFLWTWVLLEQYRKQGHDLVLGGLACVIYLTITSGYPHTILILSILMLGYLMELIFVQRLRIRAIKLFIINIGTFMATLPFLLPAFLSFHWMQRPSGIQNNGFFMPELGSVLNLSSILFLPRMHLYGHVYPSYPIMFLAWFILPLLSFLSWEISTEIIRNRLAIIIFTILTAILLFGPEIMGPIRIPIRFLPFIHTTILLTFFLIISAHEKLRLSRWRLVSALIILFIQFTTSISACPITLLPQIISSELSLILIFISVRFIYYNNITGLASLLLSGTIIVFSFTHLVAPSNIDLGDFGSSIQNEVISPAAAQPFKGYQLFIGPLISDNDWDIHIAAQGIYFGEHTINGYSALKHIGLNSKIQTNDWFNIEDKAAFNYLLSTELTTNKSILSLMRVNHLLIFNDYFEHARSHLAVNWLTGSRGKYATALENLTPNQENTTLSFASPGIIVIPHGNVTGEHEQMQIQANLNGGQLVFARLYWPGYKAIIDGKTLEASPLDNVFVKINLPPGLQGELTLLFVPPGTKIGLILAAMGIMLCSMVILISGFKNYNLA